MSQSVTPHEFRKLSDNDTVCADCGQEQHAHDTVTEQPDATPQQSIQPDATSPQPDATSQESIQPDATSPQPDATLQESIQPDATSSQQDVGYQNQGEVVPPRQEPVMEAVSTGVVAEAGRAMKYRNPWLVWLVWPLITLGIYHLVWYYKIHREMADYQPKRPIPVAGPVLVLIFLGWTIIAPFISYYNTGNRVREAQRAAGLDSTCSPLLAAVLMFAFGVNSLYLQMELNRIVERYHVPEGTPVELYV